MYLFYLLNPKTFSLFLVLTSKNKVILENMSNKVLHLLQIQLVMYSFCKIKMLYASFHVFLLYSFFLLLNLLITILFNLIILNHVTLRINLIVIIHLIYYLSKNLKLINLHHLFLRILQHLQLHNLVLTKLHIKYMH